ncbi:hypothetical protein M752DRAFT_47594 [Aspergillus phoenicis ATCC 13157]|uniref:Uncharacterized protein n=1 Tax=Aspergillus phoenicis ATCC 13157 TaxID=1353007 RepID=A0A370PCZ1_ASPPH|nr:hypothetical protein M752DRAFT_47594 [Aspergillus phoenicis ATCC 13157]
MAAFGYFSLVSLLSMPKSLMAFFHPYHSPFIYFAIRPPFFFLFFLLLSPASDYDVRGHVLTRSILIHETLGSGGSVVMSRLLR